MTERLNRRDLLIAGTASAAALLTMRRALAQPADPHAGHGKPSAAAPRAPSAPRPAPPGWRDDGVVITPNGRRMPWKEVAGVKVFHIVAEPVRHDIVDGLTIEAWGYNGGTPGPTIEVTEGDRCRFYVTNRLPEATSIHWHGVFLPNGMDGVSGLTQRAIAPGETYVYEIEMNRAGTFMYHPHFDEMVQIALGMMGMIVVHPRRRRPGRVRDHALMLSEWKVEPGARRPDPLAMSDFNMLTFNSVAFPSTAPLVAELGDRVRIRLGNLSAMDHHPIHIHGHAFRIVETDGGPVPRAAQIPETSTLVPVGSVRVLEFTADAAGDWPFHCHMTHHVMNQMGHRTAPALGAETSAAERRIRKLVPGYMGMGTAGMGEMSSMKMPVPDNSVPMKGADGPFGPIDMGGMFTLIKIRRRLEGNGDPGWYDHPPGTVAVAATARQLAADGIDPDADA